MDRREPQDNDQQKIEEGFQMIKKLMQDHPEIEPNLWAGACWSVLVDGYGNSGFSYKLFCLEIDSIKLHYKKWWDEQKFNI